MDLEETLHDLLNNVNIKMVSSNDPFEQELLKSFGKFKENFSNSIKKTMDSNQPTFTQVSNDIPSISPIETKLEMQPPKKRFTPWFIFKIVLGITIFALLGLNIFTYFKTGTDAFTHFVGNTLNKGKDKLSGFFKKKSNGGKQLSTDDILSSIDKSAKNFSEGEIMGQSDLKNVVEKDPVKNKEKEDKADENYFEKDGGANGGDNDGEELGDNQEEVKDEEEEDKKLIQEEKETDPKKEYKVGKNYEASSVLDLKLAKTPGYCYVGTDRNVRTCVKVGVGDKCASGKVFPTMDLCVNPNLKE